MAFFHMTKRSLLLSICKSGINAGGIGGTRRHSFFGAFMISDGRNVSGGRGEKPGAEYAGVCISVKKGEVLLERSDVDVECDVDPLGGQVGSDV